MHRFRSTLVFYILLAGPIVMIVNGMAMLPAQLESTMSSGLLVRPHPNLYVLGTVHIGSKSAEEAQLLIEAVKPQNVIVEIPPSRLKRIQMKILRKRLETESQAGVDGDDAGTVASIGKEKSAKPTSFMDAFLMFPSFASEGYGKGGLSGLLFSTMIVWPSLLKRATTTDEEINYLPRRNEFEAAVISGERMGANIIPADLEFEDLIQTVAKSMTPFAWGRLGSTVLSESIGSSSPDPVRRRRGESIVEWEKRRRDLKTARASRQHGESTTPELTSVLVRRRDAEFARLCLDMIDLDTDTRAMTVCVVGLVHLDGVVDIVSERLNINQAKNTASERGECSSKN